MEETRCRERQNDRFDIIWYLVITLGNGCIHTTLPFNVIVDYE
jgi:hypothetical protein